MVEDPWQVLGLSRQSNKEEVKKAYHQLALKLHPDKDPSKEAAQQFQKVQRAADAILNKEVYASEAAAAAAHARRNWQGSGQQQQPESALWQKLSRRRSTPLLFSAACIVGGCALFAGAVHVNQHMYNYNKLDSAEQRLSNPSMRQQRIMELLMEKRQATAMDEATSRR